MANTKDKGDLAEVMVLADLMKQGFKLSVPVGDNSRYDLIVDRGDKLERVQVKYIESDHEVVRINGRSNVFKAGRTFTETKYSTSDIDWLAAYDKSTDRCYYVSALELGEGMTQVALRLKPSRNNQVKRTRDANQYLTLRSSEQQVGMVKLV